LWEDTLKNKKIEPVYLEAGDSITLSDSVKLSFLWPEKQVETVANLNDDVAIVFKLSYGEFDVLLTADADSRVQPYTGGAGDIEVLKVPHHGSKTALKEDFLKSLKPEVSVISLGRNNRYGHPSANLIEALSHSGSKVYRTDQNGTIEIVSDGIKWYTQTEK
jgi:competence protein ComEC